MPRPLNLPPGLKLGGAAAPRGIGLEEEIAMMESGPEQHGRTPQAVLRHGGAPMRWLMRPKIHNATVTEANLAYVAVLCPKDTVHFGQRDRRIVSNS